MRGNRRFKVAFTFAAKLREQKPRFFRAAADRVDVRAQLGEEGAISRRSRRACPASEIPASPQSRT